jgi:hypothetical protein
MQGAEAMTRQFAALRIRARPSRVGAPADKRSHTDKSTRAMLQTKLTDCFTPADVNQMDDDIPRATTYQRTLGAWFPGEGTLGI